MTAAGLITGALLALGLLARELAFVPSGAREAGRRRSPALWLLALAFATLTVIRIAHYL